MNIAPKNDTVNHSLYLKRKKRNDSIQTASSNRPRWENTQLQNSIFFSSLKKTPELDTKIKALKLESFLHLMMTCKAMYNYSMNWLELKAVISITFAKSCNDRDNFEPLKLKFANRNKILTKALPAEFNVHLFDLQNLSTILVTALKNGSKLTLLIKSDAECTQLSTLLKKNKLSQQVLWILSQIKFNFTWLPNAMVDYEGFQHVIKDYSNEIIWLF